MIFQTLKDDGTYEEKELRLMAPIVGRGFDRVVLTGEEVKELSRTEGSLIIYFIKRLATRGYT